MMDFAIHTLKAVLVYMLFIQVCDRIIECLKLLNRLMLSVSFININVQLLETFKKSIEST